MNVIHQVAPRYTFGSPAQVDPATAQAVKVNEIQNYREALAGMAGPDEQAKAQAQGLAGIVETLVDYPDGTRQITDEITGESRTVRPQPVRDEVTPADELKTDLRFLQDLVDRRGAKWLAKWAGMFQGVEKNTRTRIDMAQALKDGDVIKAEYLGGDPDFVLDPRN